MGLPYIYRRGPLVFPGRASGFDPSHVAAGSPRYNQFLFSGVARGANFINLLNGSKGTLSGAPVATISGNVGPASDMSVANGGQITFPFNTTLIGTTIPLTVAAIVEIGGQNDSPFSFLGNNTGGGFSIGYNHYSTPPYAINFNSTTGTIVLLPNTPYFFACSTFSGNASTNCLVLNLLTGQVQTEVIAAPGYMNNSSGQLQIGPSSGYAGDVAVAAAMVSAVSLSVAQLLQWAQAPWDFWYPPTVESLLFKSFASAGGIVSIFPNRRTLMGVGT